MAEENGVFQRAVWVPFVTALERSYQSELALADLPKVVAFYESAERREMNALATDRVKFDSLTPAELQRIEALVSATMREPAISRFLALNVRLMQEVSTSHELARAGETMAANVARRLGEIGIK